MGETHVSKARHGAPGLVVTRELEEAESLLSLRRCGEALACFQEAERGGADADACAAGRWMAWMLLGEYPAAWRESDAIRERGTPDAHRFWRGEALEGRRVMLRCLHGYGDTVMYLRWLPRLRARAREVVVQVSPEMVGLVERMPDAGRVVTWEAAEDWEVQVECAELPYLFRATVGALPAPVRMAFGEAERRGPRERLGVRTKPRVGLVWTGSGYDPARSIPFPVLRERMLRADFVEAVGVEFWSLQAAGNDAAWMEFCGERGWGARVFYERDGDGGLKGAEIDEMAAFAREMDLVITIDTLAAHVAGSLGVPVWLMLKREADWRWMVGREDSPWYPGMRLFRQGADGDWDGVLGRVCGALGEWCEGVRG